MQLIITLYNTDNCKVIEIPDDAEIDMLFQMIHMEFNISIEKQLLTNDATNEIIYYSESIKLVSKGIVDGCSIIIKENLSNTSTQSHQSTLSSHQQQQQVANNMLPNKPWYEWNADQLMTAASLDPSVYEVLKEQQFHDLVEALKRRDRTAVSTNLCKVQMKIYFERKEEVKLLQSADDDVDAQIKIAEKIRKEQVQHNLMNAIDMIPEAFASVTMLYVNIAINNVNLQAFVDSGAQVTVMSYKMAELCGITYLIDERYKGVISGVGTQTSLGRIHAVQMKFGESFIAISITVLEMLGPEFLLGLDNLKRLRGVIDLDFNVLKLDGANGKESVPFLNEYELTNKKEQETNKNDSEKMSVDT